MNIFANTRLIVCLAVSIAIHIVAGVLVIKLFQPSEEDAFIVAPAPAPDNETVVDQNQSADPVDDSPIIEQPKVHVVKPGESLWVIAREYQVSIQKLMDINGISPSYVLKAGDKLTIPQ